MKVQFLLLLICAKNSGKARKLWGIAGGIAEAKLPAQISHGIFAASCPEMKINVEKRLKIRYDEKAGKKGTIGE